MNRLQFTTRSLLALTVVVSIAMYFAVTWPPIFLVCSFLVVYLLAMLGAFHVTAEKCSRGASVVWLACGAAILFVAAANFYLIPVGVPRRASAAEWVVRSVISLILAGIGVVGLVRSWLAYTGTKNAEAGQNHFEDDV